MTWLNTTMTHALRRPDREGRAELLGLCPRCARLRVGDTMDEVKAEIRGAIVFRLEGMRRDGSPIPEPSSRTEYVEVGEQAA